MAETSTATEAKTPTPTEAPKPAADDAQARRASHLAKQQKLDAERAKQKNLDYSGKLTPEHLRRISPAEIRAIGTTRGYSIPAGGRQAVTTAFLKAQGE